MTLREHEFTDLPTLTGPMRTHIIRPAAEGRFPGIVLWSEILQVTGPIRRTAALLAGHQLIFTRNFKGNNLNLNFRPFLITGRALLIRGGMKSRQRCIPFGPGHLRWQEVAAPPCRPSLVCVG
jgi:hypothetical protein